LALGLRCRIWRGAHCTGTQLTLVALSKPAHPIPVSGPDRDRAALAEIRPLERMIGARLLYTKARSSSHLSTDFCSIARLLISPFSEYDACFPN
jgi:hypothetical protein